MAKGMGFPPQSRRKKWPSPHGTPERQNMTKPEAVTQEAIQAAKDYLRGNGPWKDSEIGITEDDYLVRCFAKAIQAAEQRGMERESERCLREAEDADPLGKDAFGRREIIAQAIRQGWQG
jgi:hypothetical protein